MTKIYLFFEMQQKYRNKYRKFCIIRLLSSI